MMTGKALTLSAVCCGSILLAGCVMNEKYEAEKARALNFQRLLAQEEKRTGELDAELKRLKRDTPELEARNRELTAQLNAVREQMARIQEETAALRETAALKAREELHRSLQPKSPPKSKPALPKSGVERPDMALNPDLAMIPDISMTDGTEVRGVTTGAPVMHAVKPGDTLFRLSRQYGVDVKQLKEWNELQSNVIEIGQKLVVGYR
jgi:outer membrane murein-binding lipoprotein Lpp